MPPGQSLPKRPEFFNKIDPLQKLEPLCCTVKAIGRNFRSRKSCSVFMNDHGSQKRLHPKLISFDVFGTLISVRDSSYGAFERILSEVRGHQIDVRAFWEHWEHRNIAHYWDPYRSYREICELSLSETFSHFNLVGDGRLI